MHLDRQKVIKILEENQIYNTYTPAKVEGGIYITNYILDGTIYLYTLKKQNIWDTYAAIIEKPLPFLLFLLKVIDLKKEHEKESTFGELPTHAKGDGMGFRS